VCVTFAWTIRMLMDIWILQTQLLDVVSLNALPIISSLFTGISPTHQSSFMLFTITGDMHPELFAQRSSCVTHPTRSETSLLLRILNSGISDTACAPAITGLLNGVRPPGHDLTRSLRCPRMGMCSDGDNCRYQERCQSFKPSLSLMLQWLEWFLK